MKRYLVILIWLLCAYVNWGLTLGHFDHRFPHQRNTDVAGMTAFAGPFGTIVVLLAGQPYHWRVVPRSTEEIWKAYHARWPHLSREDFDREQN